MDRPRVIVFGQASVDGRISFGRNVLLLPWGESADAARTWSGIGGGHGWQERLLAVHGPSSYLEGSESFVKGDSGTASLPAYQGHGPSLYEDFLPDEVCVRPDRRGWMAVPDSRGRVRWSIKQGDGIYLLVLVARSTPAGYLAFLRSHTIPYVIAGDERVDLERALHALKERLAVQTLICTSPGKLGGALLWAGLVDEIDIEFLPAVIGGTETPSLFSSFSSRDLKPARLELLAAETLNGGHVWVRYRLR